MNILKRIIRKIKRDRAFRLINGRYAGTKHFEKKRKLLISIGYEIGENTKVVGPVFITTSLKIGKNCWIGHHFECNGNGNIVIGDNCDVAPDVSLNTGGHKIGGPERRAGGGVSHNIIIGDGCWICTRVTVVETTTIGNSCVVAAGAVVTEDIPDNSFAAGVPAVVKKSFDVELPIHNYSE